MPTEKSIENRLRRQLSKEGYMLRKSRTRNWNIDDYGEYMITDPYTNMIVAGSRFDLSLEDVERFVNE